MRAAIPAGFLVVLCLSVIVRAADAPPPKVQVEAGESIQNAIDAAADGSIITIAQGTYRERLTVGKPITLRGAGWDKTIIKPEKAGGFTVEEKDEFFRKLEATTDPRERMKLATEIAGPRLQPPTITVKSTDGVTIEKLKVSGPATASDGNAIAPDTLVMLDGATQTKIRDCAVLGPYGNGITVTNGSSAEISGTLVAAMWGSGIQIAKATTVTLSDSDIRNCYHRGVTISSDKATVKNCRISGSAWHGIRYDHCSPSIIDNHIFANARSGIYASGNTAATVRGNIFTKNEMDGISCWFNNVDNIEANIFADNLREGLAVLGDSKPTLSKNIIARNPIGIMMGGIRGRDDKLVGSPQPKLLDNTFWKNEQDIKLADKTQPLPQGNKSADPKLDEAKLTPTSAWEITPEEKAIIPHSETRDYSKWKTTTSAR